MRSSNTRPKRNRLLKSKAKDKNGNIRDHIKPIKADAAKGNQERENTKGIFDRKPKQNKKMQNNIQLKAPLEQTFFIDKDRNKIQFVDSKLRRIAAEILKAQKKSWRYKAFPFPIFNEKGNEQTLIFDFYIYDQDTIIKLITIVPYESKELWDKIGKFKKQYPMYNYELWTPEKLSQLQKKYKLGQ